MAIYIKLNKITQVDNDVHTYEVITQDFKYPQPLFVQIDIRKKILYFIIDQNPVCTTDLKKPDFNCPILPEGLVIRVYKKISKAIINNDFPEYLDYVS